MITKYKVLEKYDFYKERNAYNIEEVIVSPDIKNRIKVFIPSLMPLVQRGEPMKRKVYLSTGAIFKNENYPLITSSTLEEQNYLTTEDLDTTNINDMNYIFHRLNNSNYEVTLKKDSLIRTFFANNKLSYLKFRFNTDTEQIRPEYGQEPEPEIEEE